MQLATALKYYASGDFQINVGDMMSSVSQPSVSRIVTTISKYIASLAQRFIRMPTGNNI